jgi:hypothetical protein
MRLNSDRWMGVLRLPDGGDTVVAPSNEGAAGTESTRAADRRSARAF